MSPRDLCGSAQPDFSDILALFHSSWSSELSEITSSQPSATPQESVGLCPTRHIQPPAIALPTDSSTSPSHPNSGGTMTSLGTSVSQGALPVFTMAPSSLSIIDGRWGDSVSHASPPPSPPFPTDGTKANPPARKRRIRTTTSPPLEPPPRLRKSCDGCFKAKVKCNITTQTGGQYICRRCIQTGCFPCKFSPTSRATRWPNKFDTAVPSPSPPQGTGMPLDSPTSGFDGGLGFTNYNPRSMAGPAGYTPPASDDGRMSRSHSALGTFELAAVDQPYSNSNLDRLPFVAGPYSQQHLPPQPGSWGGINSPTTPPFPQESSGGSLQTVAFNGSFPDHTGASIAPSYFPPSIQPQVPLEPTAAPHAACTCSKVAWEHLQAYASDPSVPEVDGIFHISCVIMTLREAVNVCRQSCSFCTHHFDPNQPIILLWSALTRILKLYRRTAFQYPLVQRQTVPGFGNLLGGWNTLTPDGRWEPDNSVVEDDRNGILALNGRFHELCSIADAEATRFAQHRHVMDILSQDALSAIHDIQVLAASFQDAETNLNPSNYMVDGYPPTLSAEELDEKPVWSGPSTH